MLEIWLHELSERFEDRILPIHSNVSDIWGRIRPVPIADGLMAATAIHHDLTLATRNVRDVEELGASVTNPFDSE